MSVPRKSFRTPKGTELPLLNLKGKEYLMVAHRLVFFREANPTGVIKTSMLAQQGEGPSEYCIFKAEVFVDTERGPMLVSSAHKRESRADFPDFIEKAESSAIGRALGMAGYGTQFTADELNEGNRLADSPLERIDKTEDVVTAAVTTTATSVTPVSTKRTSFRKTVSTPVASTSNGAGDDI